MSTTPELEFDAAAWTDMAPAERVRRCLLFAHEATQLASNAAADIKSAYADLSKQWLALAAEIEKNHPTSGPSS